VERLRHERHRLALLRAGDLSVRTAFSLSYQQLSDDARRLFRRLWLIPAADFGLAAAPALLGRPEPDSESALDELVAASLVETAGPSGRYGCTTWCGSSPVTASPRTRTSGSATRPRPGCWTG
jgi:hypothetical protein